MADTTSHLGDEFEGHKANLTGWIAEIEKLPTPESRKGVHDRFVRDCNTLITDLDKNESPSSSDIVDFEDAHNSLEVRYHQLTDSAS